MKPERARVFLDALQEQAPIAWAQAIGLTAGAIKARPVFVQKQPPDRRAELIRKALSRVASAPVAEELLAVYFLECRNELLVEWLDAIGIEHDKGTLTGEPSEPEAETLQSAVEAFRKAGRDESDGADRELLLRAFAAQIAIDWPNLDRLLDAS
jgi:hypothetical protein